MKWRYGNSWEKYPIEEGEIWRDPLSGSTVSVCDITRQIPGYMLDADMIYCDPPWNLANSNGFITKAGKKDYIAVFEDFYQPLFSYLSKVKAKACYVEIGKQNRTIFEQEMKSVCPCVQTWEITYYKRYPCFLIRGGAQPLQNPCFSGEDDVKTPRMAIMAENPQTIADPCTGQGLTAIAAYKHGKTFFGTELNKRRLAVAIDKTNKMGAQYEKNTIS